MNKSNSDFKQSIKVQLIGVTLIVIIAIGYVFYSSWVNKEATNLGEQVVMLLYNYDKVEDLQTQDKQLKEITTDDAYDDLTATNANKALNTYLKFKGNAVKVKVIRSNYNDEGGYVLYTLKTDSLSDGRLFEMLYDVKDGKLDNPREMECVDFYGNDRLYVNPKDEGDDDYVDN